MLDARTGASLHTTTLPEGTGGGGDVAVAAGTGRVFVATGNGLLLLDATNGAPVPLPADVADRLGGDERGPFAVDERRRRVVQAFVGDTSVHGDPLGQGTAEVLDAASGMPLAERLVDVAPVAVAEDTQSGLIYVLNQHDICPVGREPGYTGSVSVFASDIH